jgi:hypothetical protein
MRLLSQRAAAGDERLAVATGNGLAVDASDLLGDGPWTMDRLLGAMPDGLDRLRRAATASSSGHAARPIATLRRLPPVVRLIAHCSRSFTLEPGDVIATGTPGGVGAFREPPLFLADGDVVEVAIDGVGSLTNRCRVVP